MVAVGHDGGSGRDTYIHAPAPIALPILGHALQAPKNATSHSTSRTCRLTRMVLPAAAAGWQRSSVYKNLLVVARSLHSALSNSNDTAGHSRPLGN